MQQRGQKDRHDILRAYGIDEVHVVMDNGYTKQPSQQSGAYSMQISEDLRDYYCRQMLSEMRFYNALFILFLGYYGQFESSSLSRLVFEDGSDSEQA